MTVVLKWVNRAETDTTYVYRSETKFDISSLPTPLATFSTVLSTYADDGYVVGTTYYYAIGQKMSGSSTIVLSDLVSVTPSSGGGTDTAALFKADFENGTNGLQDATDESTYSVAITWFGATAVSNAGGLSGSLSLYSNATSDYIGITPPDLSGDFTLEFEMKQSNFASGNYPVAMRNAVATDGTGADGSWVWWINSGNVSAIYSNVAYFSIPNHLALAGKSQLSNNSRHHLAVTHKASSGVFNLWVDGVLEATATDLTAVLTAPETLTYIAGHPSALRGWLGYMDNIRIGNDERYTYNFETGPGLPGVDGTVTPTALQPALISCQGADTSTTIQDDNHTAEGTFTVNGDAQLTTTQAPSGSTSSLYSPGGAGYLVAPEASNFRSNFGANDFTVECDAYPVATGNTNRAMGGSWSNASSEFQWFFGLNNGKLAWWWHQENNTGVFWTSTTVVPDGAWAHLAVARQSGVTRMYVNGTNVYTSAVNNHMIRNDVDQPYWLLGIESSAGSTSGAQWGGYLANFKITRGIALYTT